MVPHNIEEFYVMGRRNILMYSSLNSLIGLIFNPAIFCMHDLLTEIPDVIYALALQYVVYNINQILTTSLTHILISNLIR